MNLDQIIDDLVILLKKNNYSDLTINTYTKEWHKLRAYMIEKYDSLDFTIEIGTEYLKEAHNIEYKFNTSGLKQSEVQFIRYIHLLDDYMLHGVLTMRYTSHKNSIILTGIYKEYFDSYTTYLKQSALSKVTVEHYIFICRVFLDYMNQKEIFFDDTFGIKVCDEFIKTFIDFSFKTVEQRICGMRHFLRYLDDEKLFKNQIADKIHIPNVSKQAGIPSVWKPEELKSMLDAIDRNSPVGKRDYAMILTAALLGIRFGDIRRLRFENIDWKQKKLSIIQHKTGKPLILPIPDQLGWAIIDYIKNGRPKYYDTSIIFIKHMPPFNPISSNMSQTIKRYMNKAGLSIDKNVKRGFHSLRHTAASFMLENGTELPVISEILGHSSTDITSVYLKTDISKLKECVLPLDFDDFEFKLQ